MPKAKGSKRKENGRWTRMLDNGDKKIYLPCLEVFKFGFFLWVLVFSVRSMFFAKMVFKN